MPPENSESDLSEMQPQVDPVSGGTAEVLSEVSEYGLEYDAEEVSNEEARYRVRLNDNERIGTPLLYLEYFKTYEDAYAQYVALCDDGKFIKHHKDDLTAEIQKSYRGKGEVYWETVLLSVIYDDS